MMHYLSACHADLVHYAELKSENALTYVSTKTWLGNRAFMSAVLIAHNLTRELTMLSEECTSRVPDDKRAPLWIFPRIDTLRQELFITAGWSPYSPVRQTDDLDGYQQGGQFTHEAALHTIEVTTLCLKSDYS